MKSGEVGVDVTVEIQVASGLDNHAHVASAMQVTNERFDGGSVAFVWIVTESSDWLMAKAMSGQVLVDK